VFAQPLSLERRDGPSAQPGPPIAWSLTNTRSNIYIKLDNLQPSGSFKLRGIGNLVFKAAAAKSGAETRFYCSSGGNAGLACATAAAALNMPAIIVVPTTTKTLMIAKLKLLGAEVHQIGANWAEADQFLRKTLLAKDPDGVYVPPFDHPWVWDGASSIIDELVEQMPGVTIDAIVCSVGGGGLLNGIMQGIERTKWPGGNVPKVMAVETKGAESLNASILAGEHITLPAITSIASSLGAPKVSDKTWDYCKSPNLVSIVISDAEAAISCVRFADDCRFLVEPACGATIAAAYYGHLRTWFGKGLTDAEWKEKNIVLEVCGGSAVTLGILEGYRQDYGMVV
jgi:L-serine/L-threonine ammonia-lyase